MTGFKKQYVRSFNQLAQIPLSERHKYYLDRELLREKATFIHDADPMVDQAAIEQGGIHCMPFWKDDDQGQELDSEGRAFQRYLAIHPSFGISVRQSVLPKLAAAQRRLHEHIQLVIKAAFRPVSVQREIFQEEFQNIRKQHPSWDKDKAYKYTLEFVTDPDVYLPPHASGGTLDVHLWDKTEQCYLDMGSPINAVDDRSWSANTNGLSDEQISNRAMLRSAMLKEGFAPLASEWWHFSYGDQRWAVFYDKPNSLYGAAPEEETV